MNSLSDIVICSAVRLPLGRFGGLLRRYRSFELGAMCLRGALFQAHLPGELVGQVIGGSCRQAGNGLNPVRTASLLAGLPASVPAQTLNMACPSGMKAIALGAQAIMISESDIALACGMDSMSTIPHLVRGLRFDAPKFGDMAIEDGWKDATDPFTGMSMGETAEKLAQETGISRAEQDEFALESHRRAILAWENGTFDAEVIPVPEAGLPRDEVPRASTTLEKLGTLPPAFHPNGTITAGNACAMADGAAALVLTSRKRAKELGLSPLASLLCFAQGAVEGKDMGKGPELSIPLALDRANMRLNDIDLVEINEAFAVQTLANSRALGISLEKLNVHGGAIALGHPTGVSGARIVVTLIHALRRRNAETGLAAICGGGGVTTAMILRRES
jgi:acetyl-CoA C-acetyltransferase